MGTVEDYVPGFEPETDAVCVHDQRGHHGLDGPWTRFSATSVLMGRWAPDPEGR